MTASAAVHSATNAFFRLAAVLPCLALLPQLASCTDATSAPLEPPAAVVAAAPQPGCRQQFPVEFRGISCAGHDYDPVIPYGELYPPR